MTTPFCVSTLPEGIIVKAQGLATTRHVLLNINAVMVTSYKTVNNYNLWEMTNDEVKHKQCRIAVRWKLLNACANIYKTSDVYFSF
jgi:hypothetical protein